MTETKERPRKRPRKAPNSAPVRRGRSASLRLMKKSKAGGCYGRGEGEGEGQG